MTITTRTVTQETLSTDLTKESIRVQTSVEITTRDGNYWDAQTGSSSPSRSSEASGP